MFAASEDDDVEETLDDNEELDDGRLDDEIPVEERDEEDIAEETELVAGGGVSPFLEPEPPPQPERLATKLQISKKLSVCFILIILLSAALRDSLIKYKSQNVLIYTRTGKQELWHFSAEKLTQDEQLSLVHHLLFE